MDNFLEPYGLDMAMNLFFGPSNGHDGRHTCHIRHCPCTLIINNEEKYLDDFVKNFEKKKDLLVLPNFIYVNRTFKSFIKILKLLT